MGKLDGPRRAPWHWGIGLLIIVGAALRAHFLGRSLWLDEAWVANSVLETELSGVFYYDSWLQTSPPLFLILVRSAVGLFGVSNETLRLVPLVFGLLGMICMAYLALRLLRPSIAFIITFLLVFSPAHITFSQTLKQYPSDLFASVVLMALGMAYLSDRSAKTLAYTIGAFFLLSVLSYNSVLFMPALLYGAMFATCSSPGWRLRLRVRWPHVLAVVAPVAVMSSLNYFYFIRPNLDDNILDGGASTDSLSAVLRYPFVLAKEIAAVFKHFFYANQSWREDYVPLILGLFTVFVALLGTAYLCWRAGRGQPKNIDKAAVLVLPILSASFLNIIGYYPLGVLRLNLFLFPAVLILFGFGLYALLVAGRWRTQRVAADRPARLPRRFQAAVALVSLVALLGMRILAYDPSPYLAWPETSSEDAEAAIAYMSEHVSDDDVVYVDTSMREPFKWYARFYPIRADKIIYGNVGWPCCPRNAVLNKPSNHNGYIEKEIKSITLSATTDSLWLFFTTREYHWVGHVGRDHPGLFELYLRKQGCVRDRGPVFTGVQLDRYDCDVRGAVSVR